MKSCALSIIIVCLLGVTPALGQVRINEVSIDVDYEGQPKWVELFNAGSSAVDVSAWELCLFPVYDNLGTEVPLLIGTTNIQPGEYLVVGFSALVASGAEVGLYSNDINFGDAANMVDYMEYIIPRNPREGVAVTAGVWTDSTAVAEVPAGKTYSFFEGGATPVENWAAGDPTPGAQNAVATSVTEIPNHNDFRLRANYPNPFNSTTQITFDLGQAASVSLAVYDALGREQLSIPGQMFAAGSGLSIALDGKDFAPGTYVYKVVANAGTGSPIVRSGTLTVVR